MLQVLQPIWLFAMAGVLIPVVIHLWNNKQGKVLAIGSIVFLERASRKKARSWKVTEWLLLLLRCLLLALLVLLLAGPYWRRSAGGIGKGWVLTGVVGEHGAAIDSLVKAGYERHELRDSSWWEGFSKYDREAPAGIPFYVFADDALRHFRGRRPESKRTVYWFTSRGRNDIFQWVDKRWPVGRDSVASVMGSSGPTGTSFRYSQAVRRQGDVLDTAVLRVAVYADGIDGQWVTAGVRAVQQHTHRNIQVMTYEAGQKVDWLFWLSGKALPEGVRAANVLFYEPGKEIPVDTWIRNMEGVQVEKVVVARQGQADSLEAIWQDGFGRMLLGVESGPSGMRRCHFYSRFDPAWNGLVWSAEFPGVLAGLMLEEGGRVNDRRVIDQGQIMPGKGEVAGMRPVSKEDAGMQSGDGMRTVSKADVIDLAPAGWILIWLLLLIERVLSYRKSK